MQTTTMRWTISLRRCAARSALSDLGREQMNGRCSPFLRHGLQSDQRGAECAHSECACPVYSASRCVIVALVKEQSEEVRPTVKRSTKVRKTCVRGRKSEVTNVETRYGSIRVKSSYSNAAGRRGGGGARNAAISPHWRGFPNAHLRIGGGGSLRKERCRSRHDVGGCLARCS